jgi:hypothetical protein
VPGLTRCSNRFHSKLLIDKYLSFNIQGGYTKVRNFVHSNTDAIFKYHPMFESNNFKILIFNKTACDFAVFELKARHNFFYDKLEQKGLV